MNRAKGTSLQSKLHVSKKSMAIRCSQYVGGSDAQFEKPNQIYSVSQEDMFDF